jgi:hypothetical protein
MRPARHWLAVAITIATLTLPRPSAAQVLDPIQYSLFKSADFGYGCDGPCECPFVFSGSLDGTFTFYRTSVDPLYTHYALLNIRWSYPVPGTGKTATLTGHGTYDIGGEVANMQRMQLDVVTDGVLAQHFDSGLVPARGIFPAIDIDVRVAVNACIDSVLHVVAGPQGTDGVPPSGPTMQLTAAPNPTRAGTVVVLSLPEAETGVVEVLNVAGQRVAELARGTIPAGDSRWHWDGRTSSGTDAGAGVFWVRARLGASTVTQGFVRFR